MKVHPARGALAAAIVASALAACSAPSTSGPPAPDGLAVGPATTAPAGTTAKAKPRAKSSATSTASSPRDTGRGPAATGSPSRSGGADSTPVGAVGTPTVSCMHDRVGDVEYSGSPPAYIDLVRACVRQTSSGVRLEITGDGAIPARMPDEDTVTTLGFELTLGSGTRTSVVVEGTDAGWSAYLTRGQGRTALTSARDGNTLRVPVSAAGLDGAHTFRWRADSSWTNSKLLSTSYAFDSAPDAGQATYQGS